MFGHVGMAGWIGAGQDRPCFARGDDGVGAYPVIYVGMHEKTGRLRNESCQLLQVFVQRLLLMVTIGMGASLATYIMAADRGTAVLIARMKKTWLVQLHVLAHLLWHQEHCD